MITGLSLSSQVKSTVKINAQIIESVNPIIYANPIAETPSDPSNTVLCDAGSAYYVNLSGCATVNITCNNGNNYIVIFCPNEPTRTLQTARTTSGGNMYNTTINVDITSNVVTDGNTQLDPISRVVNQRKILNSYITLSTDLVFNFTTSTLIIKQVFTKLLMGNYK